jgi:hypothetical protein
MRLDHVFARALDAPETVLVAAYSRPMNLAARRFERGALAEMEPEIVAGLEEAVSGVGR